MSHQVTTVLLLVMITSCIDSRTSHVSSGSKGVSTAWSKGVSTGSKFDSSGSKGRTISGKSLTNVKGPIKPLNQKPCPGHHDFVHSKLRNYAIHAELSGCVTLTDLPNDIPILHCWAPMGYYETNMVIKGAFGCVDIIVNPFNKNVFKPKPRSPRAAANMLMNVKPVNKACPENMVYTEAKVISVQLNADISGCVFFTEDEFLPPFECASPLTYYEARMLTAGKSTYGCVTAIFHKTKQSKVTSKAHRMAKFN